MFVAAALPWNWLGGYVGQVSFGHAAMFGVGGFVAARLIPTLGQPFPLAWLVGGLVAGAFGLAWGHPTLRLRGPHFSIATIGVGQATRLVLTYWEGFTGGSSGVSLPIAPGLKYTLYWYELYLMAVVVAASYAIRRSRLGLGLLAIKADVGAAADVGVAATFGTIRTLHEDGMTILLVEQNLKLALEVADRGYVIETGRIRLQGPSTELLANADVRASYLGA